MQTVTEESLHTAVIVPARWPVREEDCGARWGRREGGMKMARWGTSASKGPWVAVRASVGTEVLAALSSSAEVTRSPSPERRGEPRSLATVPATLVRCQVWRRSCMAEILCRLGLNVVEERRAIRVTVGVSRGLQPQLYADFLTWREPAMAERLLSIRRIASGSNTISPQAGHLKNRSCWTVYWWPLNSPDQFRRTERIRSLPHEGQA